jgi:hypothetical protein
MVYNCKNDNERYKLEQEVRASDEWAEFERAIAEAQHRNTTRAQISEKTTQSEESKPTAAASTKLTKAPQSVELGKGGVRFVRQGECTVALPCGPRGEMLESSTVSAVKVSYDILSVELPKVYSIVKGKRGKISGAELRMQFRRSPLAGVADEQDWNDWAEGFSPTNPKRGRPKGAALTFLERKMALNRND